MTSHSKTTHVPRLEHSVPWFWPFAAAIELGDEGMAMFVDNLHYLAEAEKINVPPEPTWATANVVLKNMATMRLRDFTPPGSAATGIPAIIDAPYAGHSATIADYARGQSLVETLQANGLQRVLVTDWKPATHAMKDYDIDKYLTDIDTAVTALGGVVDLIGLCQGGWMSAMYAARFPHKVRCLVLAGAPIDTAAGNGPIKKLAHSLPMKFYQDMVDAGGGCMPGQAMLAGWKNMNPDKQYVEKYLELYQHIEDKNYIERTEHFESWYENPVNLPGAYYLQAIGQIFKENLFAKGRFIGLGQQLSLKDIVCPVYLLAGSEDDITTKEQVFDADKYLGTPKDHIVRKLASGGHIGLFMGKKTLAGIWPGIARWIQAGGQTV